MRTLPSVAPPIFLFRDGGKLFFAHMMRRENCAESWDSQGALCAHKCVNRVDSAARKQVKGLATFGDENELMDYPSPVPTGLPFKSYCNEDNASPDLLCTKTALSGIDLPSSIAEWKSSVYDSLSLLKEVAKNRDQLKAAASIPVSILSEFFGVSKYFLIDVATGNVRRWLVVSLIIPFVSSC